MAVLSKQLRNPHVRSGAVCKGVAQPQLTLWQQLVRLEALLTFKFKALYIDLKDSLDREAAGFARDHLSDESLFPTDRRPLLAAPSAVSSARKPIEFRKVGEGGDCALR